MVYAPTILLLILTVICGVIALRTDNEGDNELSNKFVKATIYYLLTAMITLTIALK